MKKIYFFFLLSFTYGTALAQPTLTAANSNPSTGQSFEKKLFTPVSNQQGTAGANQVWDWSGASESHSGTGNFVNPAGTPYSSSYPSANYCLHAIDGSYEYLIGNSTALFRIGFQSPASGLSSIYSNSAQLMKYPFSINGTFTDTYQSAIVVPTDAGTLSGTVIVTADGWGTLITPSGTFTNVLRVHAQYDEVYAYNTFGNIPQTYDQYSYWKPDVHFPLAEYTTGLQGGNSFSNASWNVSTVGVGELSAETCKLSVYPNPVNANGEITYSLGVSSEVILEIRDVTGRIVQSFLPVISQPGRHTVPVDCSALGNGIYMVSLMVNGQMATYKMIVNH